MQPNRDDVGMSRDVLSLRSEAGSQDLNLEMRRTLIDLAFNALKEAIPSAEVLASFESNIGPFCKQRNLSAGNGG